jgi:hypothetical protein
MAEGDGDRWLTYSEIGELLGITANAARNHARRRGWQRRSPNAIGAHARVLVPDNVAVQPRAAHDRPDATHDRPDATHTDAPMSVDPNGHDAANEQGYVEALCAAITALSATVTAERDRATCAEQRFEALSAHAEQRFEELLAALADARAAERIAADSAAGLRHQLDLLHARRTWWRRLFR